MNHHLIAFALSQPWALRPEVMNGYAAVLARRLAGKLAGRDESGPEDEVGMGTPIQAARPTNTVASGGGIAVIPIRGTIVQRADQLPLCEGGTTTEDIGAALRMALADNSVSQILLHIHSPGGSVYGVQELGDQIRAARAQKPIVAMADSLAASAAYWIGCSASEFYMTPGGEVGSIGVWMAHQDMSKALAAAGVDISLISAGKFKTEGNPYGPLPDDARAFLQSRTDDYYAAFTQAVAKGRNVPIASVRDGMGQGRVLGADAAMAEKMVDGVMPLPDLIRKMQRDAQVPRGSRSAQINREIEILSLQ